MSAATWSPFAESDRRYAEAAARVDALIRRTSRTPRVATVTPRRGRRLPPYARDVIAALHRPDTWRQYAGTAPDGRAVTICVAIGTRAMSYAGRAARQGDRLAIAVPPDLDPGACSWSWARGHDPILLIAAGEVDGQHAEATVRALLRDGVGRVQYLGPAGLIRYLPLGVSHG